jgi:hypothetical protein
MQIFTNQVYDHGHGKSVDHVKIKAKLRFDWTDGHVSWIKLENRKTYFKMFAINIYCWTP